MRKSLLILLFLIAACSEKVPDRYQADGPEVGVSSAPGIAVNYKYGFRLPVERIAATQEDNAGQCEALGAAVCRVAAMTYHVGRDRSVTGSLELRLAPDAARRYGKAAIQTVSQHGGMLTDANIESEEAGAAQAAARDDNAARDQERAQIQAQLGQPGLGGKERTALQDRLSTLADATRHSTAVVRDATFKLTQTPVTLEYESGQVDLSLSDGPVLGAVKDGLANIVSGFAMILLIVITLIPWIVAALLIGFGFYWINKWVAGPPAPPKPEETD